MLISMYTAPLTIYHFHELTLQPILANILIIPYITIIIIPSLFISCCIYLMFELNILISLINLEFILLDKITHFLSCFSYTVHMPEICIALPFFILILLPFAHSRTDLKYLHLLILPIFVITILFPYEKPLILMDRFGRIGYMKDNTLYVSFAIDTSLALKWKKYFHAQDIIQFKNNNKEAIFGYYLHSSIMHNKHISIQHCMQNEGMAIYKNAVKGLNNI